MQKEEHYDYLRKTMDILVKYDLESECYLNNDLIFESNMNDMLERGTAESLLIEPGDLELLEKTLEDARKIDSVLSYGLLLFHARKEKRPVCNYNLKRWRESIELSTSRYYLTFPEDRINTYKMFDLLESAGEYV